MTGTIPASFLVEVTPGVLSAGGASLNLNGLVISQSRRVPIGQVANFPGGASVTSFFGAGSPEDVVANGGANLGSGYFSGFTNSDVTPGALLIAQWPQVPVAAWLQGGNISALPLASLQAISGSLTVVVDGYSHVISSLSLSAATSFSSAATIIAAAFTDPTEASVTASMGASFTGTGSGTNLTTSAVTGLISVGDTLTGTGIGAGVTIVSQTSGTPGGAGVYVTSASTTASGACTCASFILDVTVVSSGTVSVGQTVTGTGIGAGTIVTALGTGTGLTGTYVTGVQSHAASEAVSLLATAPTVVFDSISGGFVITSGITGAPSTIAYATGTAAAPLLLTQATGATESQGSAAQTPAAFMNGVVGVTQDFAAYMVDFDPDGGSGNTQKQAFAAWKNQYPNRYAYITKDTDITPTESVPAMSSLGYILAQNGDSGTFLIYEPTASYNYSQAALAYGASLNFEETNGRTTMAFRQQAGLVPSVTNAAIAANLGGSPQQVGSYGNGYNYYGAFATANQSFVGFQRGTVTGPFQWLDSYMNQIWMNSNFQLALMELLQNTKSIPYNAAGNALIEAALADPINQAGNFGAWQPGVALSQAQMVEVDQAAGLTGVGTTLATRGWYLQIGTASSTVRQSRGTPPITFWYVDGGSVQSFAMASIVVQ